MRAIKLVMVTEENNNKFINILPNQDGTFTSNWGRVGSAGKNTVYPSCDFNKYVNSKLAKGYSEITELVSEPVIKVDSFKGLDSFSLELVKNLTMASKDNLYKNYSMNLSSVTQAQIEKAQSILDDLNEDRLHSITLDKENINSKLKKLYTTLPRKMSNTKDFLLLHNDMEWFRNLLQNEQKLLDTLTSQITTNQVSSGEEVDISKLGLKIIKATKAECDSISSATDFRLTSNHKVWKVTNTKTEKAFNPNKLSTKLLYHGSKDYNYWSILTSGLKIRPCGIPTTGTMFGRGLYFADQAQKSIGYTSLDGSRWANGRSNKAYLCVFEVATGKEWDLLNKGKKSYESSMGYIDENRVKEAKKDSVFASGGSTLRMNEYVVYNSNQATIRYVIEITK